MQNSLKLMSEGPGLAGHPASSHICCAKYCPLIPALFQSLVPKAQVATRGQERRGGRVEGSAEGLAGPGV